MTLADLGAGGGFRGDFAGSLTSGVTTTLGGSVVIVLYWASRLEADRICSDCEWTLGVGVIGFCRFVSSSSVMHKVLVGVSGSMVMTWSVDWNSAGGGSRLPSAGSKAGVLGSDGSWEDDFRGLVCSDPPSETV